MSKIIDVTYEECFKQAREILLYEPLTEKDYIIFDVDDTLITYNGDRKWFFARLHNGTIFPAIPEILNLYKFCCSLPVSIVIVTARKTNQIELTKKNLSAIGVTDYESIFFKRMGNRVSSSEYKKDVRNLLQNQGRLLMNIGDQRSDLISDESDDAIAKYSFKLPSKR